MTLFKIAVAVLALMSVVMQPAGGLAQTPTDSRAATGGAQTLEDILARQRGEKIDDAFRRNATGSDAAAADISQQLGTLGGASDPELWRALRFGSARVTATSRGPATDVVIQDSGMAWLKFRKGPLAHWGGYLLLGMLGVLALFYALRGKIRLDGQPAGQTILRFSAVERFAHWLLAGSFVLLGVTGLLTLFGRVAIIPLIGKDAFAPIAIAGKWLHNNVAWAFMMELVMVTILWIAQNLPNRHDLKWLALGGGLFVRGVHPPARKFNAGQKIIFWSVLIFGISISATGLSLLFPFELPMFAATFTKLNALGLPQMFGFGELPGTLGPYQEMQLAQAWHSIVAFLFMAIILAHIYLGTVGMQGAFDAMGNGTVDVQWAKEHHGLWYDEVMQEDANPASTRTPAE